MNVLWVIFCIINKIIDYTSLKEYVMKVGGLFAGIGGIELGFKKAGFNIEWANKIDKNACIIYQLNKLV